MAVALVVGSKAVATTTSILARLAKTTIRSTAMAARPTVKATRLAAMALKIRAKLAMMARLDQFYLAPTSWHFESIGMGAPGSLSSTVHA